MSINGEERRQRRVSYARIGLVNDGETGLRRPIMEGESREELLERLLDPELTLCETAKLLNVCKMTVRRYTNKGILAHVRTAGNQRRFKLSDVLQFMEKYGARR